MNVQNPRNPYNYDKIRSIEWTSSDCVEICTVYPLGTDFPDRAHIHDLIPDVRLPLLRGDKHFYRMSPHKKKIKYKVTNDRPQS